MHGEGSCLHGGDPGPGGVPVAADSDEYLVRFAVEVPSGTSPEALAGLNAKEAECLREAAAEDRLIRLWTLPGRGRGIGPWRAPAAGRLREILRSPRRPTGAPSRPPVGDGSRDAVTGRGGRVSGLALRPPDRQWLYGAGT
ncbi:muconolactone Delta-isomerase family protein [Streptomyces sp. NPDC096040]|uniref:muconolactone Delta-isomerase family protein n=1 Tax=Streptomyces sp. NPDC096040 TaxID=3155541 RepID=UPI00331895D0